MKKTKLLVILPSTEIGGAETKTFNLLNSLYSFDIILFTQRKIYDYFSTLEIKTYIFEDFRCEAPHIISVRNIFSYARAIKNVSSIEKPDIILGIMHFGALFAILAHDMFFLKSIALVTIEGNISAYYKNIGRPPTVKERLLLTYFLKRARAVIVPSEGVKEDIIHNFGARNEKVEMIYNGIGLEHVRNLAREEITLEKDSTWIVTSCRLNSQKDFKTLFKAFKIIRDRIKSKLLIIGDGELRQEISQWASEIKIDRDLLMLGFQENPFKYIIRSDIFVLSSFFEGMPMTLLEAMALGVPVVSTDSPSGPSEMIIHGESGFLVPVKDYQGIASSCLNILNNNKLREDLIKNSLERVKLFTIEKMAERYSRYFYRLIG